MRSLGYAIACSVLAIGTTAQAQSISAVGVGDAHANVGNLGASWELEDREGIYTRGVRGGSVEVKVDINSNSVRFESGVAVGGKNATATSNSGVDIELSNNGEGVVTLDKFRSTIIPAGMGFYLQDKGGQPAEGLDMFTGYGQTASNYGLTDLFGQVGADTVFASASFNFDVTHGENVLYSLAGLLTLSFDADGNLIVNDGLGAARGAMPSLVTAWDNSYALGFAWDATNLTLDLGGFELGGGQSTTIQYRTSVSAFTGVDCITSKVACLVAYSGFGDPIGRGGGVAEARMAARNIPRIDGIIFDPQDVVVFGAVAGVPEPSTWALMIIGFGAAGAALRRRRVLSYS